MSTPRHWNALEAALTGLLLAAHLVPAQASTNTSPPRGQDARTCRWGKEGPLLPDTSSTHCPPLLDDLSRGPAGDWNPWSAKPFCLYPFVKTEPKYCLYTYHGFGGDGSSISLVTSPETAAEAAALLEDPNPQWYRGSPIVPPPEGDPSPPYIVTDIPGRGKGAVATRDIRKGEVVITEPATMISMTPPRGIRTKQLTSMSHKSVGRLPESQKKRVSEMASMPGLDFLWGRFDTNAFGVDLAGNYDHRGLFPEIARINHDCRPSCYTRYSSRLLTMEAIAYRDIKKGEELSIAYTPLNLQTEDRQDIIQRWGFNCTCQLCSDPALSAASDRNRQRIAGIITEANGPQSREREVLARLSEEMKELVEAEGLESLAGDLYALLAEFWANAGFPEEALALMEIVLGNRETFRGVDHPRVEKARSVIGKLKASIKGRGE